MNSQLLPFSLTTNSDSKSKFIKFFPKDRKTSKKFSYFIGLKNLYIIPWNLSIILEKTQHFSLNHKWSEHSPKLSKYIRIKKQTWKNGIRTKPPSKFWFKSRGFKFLHNWRLVSIFSLIERQRWCYVTQVCKYFSDFL